MIHTSRCNWVFLYAVAALVSGTGIGTCQGQTTAVWNGGNGDWSNSMLWSPNGSPNSASHDVYIDNGNGMSSIATLNGDVLVGRLTIDAGDQLNVLGNRWLTIASGGFGGSGQLIVNGLLNMTSSGAALRFGTGTGQTFTLSGNGTLNLGNEYVTSAGSNNTLINQLSIVGSGNFFNLDFVNQGSIIAQGPAGISLNPIGTFDNQGTLKATANSAIIFGAGLYKNSGQVISADGSGSQLNINNAATIRGGTLAGLNGGEVYLHSDYLVLDGQTDGALTLEGDTRIAGNYYPRIRGTIVNNGTINAEPSALIRVGIANGEAAYLTGTGSINLNGAGISTDFSGTSLTSWGEILGNGHIGSSELSFTNYGQITSNGQLNLVASNSAGFTNRSVITTTPGGTINLGNGAYDNAFGLFEANGAGSQIHVTSSATIRGGILRGINGGEVYLHSDYSVLDGQTLGALTLEGNTRIAANYYPRIRGTIVNNGVIHADAGGVLRVGIADGEFAYLTGTGSIVLDSASIATAHLGTSLTSWLDISGSGQIGSSELSYTNYGVITSNGQLSLVASNSAGFTNFNKVTTTPGGTINIGNGSYENGLGLIEANGAGSQIHVTSSATIRGGTLRGINGGEVYLHSDYSVLDGQTAGELTLEGNTRIAANYYPRMFGTVYVDGAINAESFAQLRVGHAGGQTLTLRGSPAGVLELNNSYVTSQFSGNQLVNDSGFTIRGTGTIGASMINVVNNGWIGGAAGTLTVSPESYFQNGANGAVYATGGGTIDFTRGQITNNGWFVAEGPSAINITGSAVLTGYSGGVLQDGIYHVIDNGQMNLNIGAIHTLQNSTVQLFGAGSAWAPINSLTTINGGAIGARDGAAFTTVGNLTNNNGWVAVGTNGSTFLVTGTFDNNGGLLVEQGGTFEATNGSAPQYHAGTQSLNGGKWWIGGTARYAGGDIQQLNSELLLTHTSAQFLKANNSSAITGLSSVGSVGHFGLQNGASFTTQSDFTNNGYVSIGNGTSPSVLHVQGYYNQNGGTTFLDNGILESDGTISIAAGRLAGYGFLTPGGSYPTVWIDGIIAPSTLGSTSGKLSIESQVGFGFSTTPVYEWSLSDYADNLSGAGGIDWDSVLVTDGVFGSGLTVSFADWTVWNADVSLSFWHTDHEWDILKTLDGGMPISFYLAQSVFANGTFNLGIVSSGTTSTLRLYYDANAIPEPSAAGLLAFGLISCVSGLRVRRNRVRTSAG